MTENKDDYVYTLTYRAKLPETPIISKEEDEKFLYYYTIEHIEKAKAYMNLPQSNVNLKDYYLATSVQRAFYYMTPVVFVFLYRLFRIKKQNTILRSTLKSAPLGIIYFASFIYGFSGSQFNSYYQFIKNDFMKEETEEGLGKYIEFQDQYKKLLNESSNK